MIPFEDLSYIKANAHQNVEVAKDDLDTRGGLVYFLADAGFDYMLPEEDESEAEYTSDYEDEDFGYDNDSEYEEDVEYTSSGDINWNKYKRPDYVDWLKQIFDAEYMETDEFLMTPPWVFLDMTAAQFHMIDSSAFDQNSFIKFIELISDEHIKGLFPSIEARIRFCTLYVCAPEISYCESDEELLYIGNKLALKEFHKAIEDLQFFRDYRFNLCNARLLAPFCERYGIEMTHEPYKYPDFPKPSALRDWHHKAMQDARRYNSYARRKDEEEINEGIEATTESPDYKQFLYQEGNYVIKPVTCNQDLVNEGEYLNHCVGEYGTNLAEGNSYIYFIRKTKAPDIPFYTAEIKPGAGQLSYALTQLYTFNDNTNKTEDFRRFIRNWCDKKNLFVRCVV